MCAWAAPEISVITAVGPVHLERMGSLERIAQAKAEILERAQVAILNIDYPLLADLAQKAQDSGRIVWRCSCQIGRRQTSRCCPSTESCTSGHSHLRGEMDLLVATAPKWSQATWPARWRPPFLSGFPAKLWPLVWLTFPGRSPSKCQPVVKRRQRHRRHVQFQPGWGQRSRRPIGNDGRPGRQKGGRHAGDGRAGPYPGGRERQVCRQRGEVATELVVVGRTNARSLLTGAPDAGLPPGKARNLAEAVAWVSVAPWPWRRRPVRERLAGPLPLSHYP